MNEISIRSTFMSYLNQYGFFSFILPFLLVFSLIYLLLEITGIFKTDENDIVGRKVNILFSFGFALTTLSNKDIVAWMSYLIPNATIWILGVFLFILSLGIAMAKITMPRWLRGAISLIVIGAIIVIAANAILGGSGGAGVSIGPIDYSTLSTLTVLLVIFAILIAIIAWATSGGSSEESSKG